jgi:hypothetical protein
VAYLEREDEASAPQSRHLLRLLAWHYTSVSSRSRIKVDT